jgi:hypothetical protein
MKSANEIIFKTIITFIQVTFCIIWNGSGAGQGEAKSTTT